MSSLSIYPFIHVDGERYNGVKEQQRMKTVQKATHCHATSIVDGGNKTYSLFTLAIFFLLLSFSLN